MINLRQGRRPLLQPLDDFTARHVMFMSHVYVTTVAVVKFTVSVSDVGFCGLYESIGLVPFFKVLVVSLKMLFGDDFHVTNEPSDSHAT